MPPTEGLEDSRENTTKRSSDGSRRKEDGNAGGDLAPAVPQGEVEGNLNEVLDTPARQDNIDE